MDTLMRRTAKEGKFIPNKEKIQDLSKIEDLTLISKYAMRFNLNNEECKMIEEIYNGIHLRNN